MEAKSVETFPASENKAFYKAVVTLTIPGVLQAIISLGLNLVNSMMMGTLGETQLAAISLANFFIEFFTILCLGGIGITVLTAQYWGAKDIVSLKQALTLMLRIILTIAAILTIVMLFFPENLMRLFSPDPLVVEKGAIYFRTYAAAMIPMGIAFSMMVVLRTARQVKIPLISSIIAFVVNIFVNWVFIFGNLGAPRLEIRGAAIGIVCARVIEMLLIGGYTLFKEDKIAYRIKDFFQPCSAQFKTFFKFGLPAAATDFVLASSLSLSAMITGHVGTTYAAAAACVAPIASMASVINSGLNNAGCIITGNNIGNGDKQKTRTQANKLFVIALVIGVMAAAAITLLVPVISKGYNFADETRGAVSQLTYSYALMTLFHVTQAILGKGILKGGGDTRALMIVEIVAIWGFAMPLLYMGGIVWHVAPFWVYVFLKFDWIVKTVWCLLRFRGEKWMKKISA